MNIELLNQPLQNKISDEINECLLKSELVRIAVAYLTNEGINAIKPNLIKVKEVRIICGIHGNISDLHSLNELVVGSNGNIKGNVYIEKRVFHSKLYIFNREKES